MARIEFMDFNGKPMSTVKSVITEGAILKPLDFELSESSPYSSDFPWEDPNATVSLIEATTNENFALIGWDVDESSATYLQSFSVDMDTLASKILDTNDMKNLVVDNLTVNDTTILGTGDSSDEIYLQGEVIGLPVPNASYTIISAPTVSINFDTVTANHFISGNFSGTTGEFDNLKVGGQPYRPFIVQANAPIGPSVQNYLWINNANNNPVPIIMYCSVDANSSASITSDQWHPLGAVFG